MRLQLEQPHTNRFIYYQIIRSDADAVETGMVRRYGIPKTNTGESFTVAIRNTRRGSPLANRLIFQNRSYKRFL